MNKINDEDVQQRLVKTVAAGQDNATQVQKLKADSSYTFQKKGMRIKQYRFNSDTKSHWNKCKGSYKDPSINVEGKEVIDSVENPGIQAIACWQKRIKVANNGQAVVKAYDNDELASDSEDEKHLFKAERATEQEIYKQKSILLKEKSCQHIKQQQ